MNTLSALVDAQGALIDILLTLAGPDLLALRQKGAPLPQPVAARAVIDTGADVTCLDSKLIVPLIASGLPPGKFLLTNLPATGGLRPSMEYSVGLTIVHPSGRTRSNLVLRNQPVVEQALGSLGYDALIGRDVLDRCLLIYDGPGRRFSLAY